MARDLDAAFEDWKKRASEVDLLEAANKSGAKLKRAGREWVGPCPFCGGTDRFSINISKRVFNCRGFGGGDVIKMVEHIEGLSFLQACQDLTGEPPPGRQARPLSDEELRDREHRRQESKRLQREREAREAHDREVSAQDAADIWRQVKPIAGAPPERYLVEVRHIPVPPMGWPDTIGFGVVGYGKNPWADKFPCLVCRVQDVAGDTVAVHAVYLDGKTGQKLGRDPGKLTFGPMQGGAVRLGGVSDRVQVCEGVESGLGILWLTNFRRPVWCGLGTSGLAGMEFPLDVERATVWPDGDRPIKRQGHEYVPEPNPPGICAARALRDRYPPRMISINECPEAGDFLDVWVGQQRRERA